MFTDKEKLLDILQDLFLERMNRSFRPLAKTMDPKDYSRIVMGQVDEADGLRCELEEVLDGFTVREAGSRKKAA